MFTNGSSRRLGQLMAAAIATIVLPGAILDRRDVTGESYSNLNLPPVPACLDPEARAAGAGEEWRQTVAANLAREEYLATPTPEGLQAPNRAHNLRTIFGESGIQVVARTQQEVAPAWRFVWEASGFGRRDRMEAVAPATPAANGARVTYRREGWSEWYENTAKGLEQGFTIDRRPAGDGPLCIAGNFPAALHPELQADGAIDFIDAQGARVLRYGELKVWDARGVELSAELVLAANTLAIEVDDRVATYPITVDPLLTTPAWTAESNQPSCNFGVRVTTAGDVNGDGYSDVLIGASSYDNGENDEGRAYLYLGSAAGLAATPAWIAESNRAGAVFGYALSTAGDVNGDGFDDVIVGAFQYANGQTNEGRVFVYHGSPSGLSPTPSWTAESDQIGAAFGFAVSTAGDVNGDGFSDVIVGANLYDGTVTDEGQVFIYHGSASGLGAAAASRGSGQTFSHFGWSVSTAGDVNGDGFSDVIVGAIGYDNGQTDEGRAYAYQGSAAGLEVAPSWVVESDQAGSPSFGFSVSTAGDVNGDGYSDVIVGAPDYDNGEVNEGEVFLYYGRANGLNPESFYLAEGNQMGAGFGGSIALAGDVNGDGFSDVLLGAYAFDNGQTNEGRVSLYLGARSGFFCCTPDWMVESNFGGALFGTAVGTAGDVNGDGYSDLIVGATGFDNGQTDEGRVFVYHGSADGPGQARAEREIHQAGAHFGYSVSTAGDVNGDGYSDVIVGAPHFDNGQPDEGRAYVYHGFPSVIFGSPAWTAEGDQAVATFGYSVASAGDVNGDGYSDVIVGAPFYDNDESGDGRAAVYHGSPSGLSPVANWAADGNQAFCEFGATVAGAGDVNGDGFSDVIVGAPTFDNGFANEGRAFVYLGSAAGLAATPAWTAESDQDQAMFGWCVATAGDVNGDGFSDVIVSAHAYDNGEVNEGRAWVYMGSAAGLAAAPAWTGESNQAGAQFGISVSTAGDVNGDGFSDVVVGADGYDNGHSGEGRTWLYKGSAGGLATAAAWTAEVNQTNAHFGWSVGTAGDMNGDGYSDVIVGAYSYDNNFPNQGAAFLYPGSPGGLGSSSWFFDGNNQDVLFGWSVGPAGDPNGDGFSDVLVGVEAFGNGQSEEGRMFVFLGNDATGIDRRPRQARTDDTAPISFLGRSNSQSAFGLKVLGRTAVGRGRVRLQFEVKPLGVPFDGTGLVTGPAVDTGTPTPQGGTAVLLTEIAGGLAPETPYHWRLRTLANSPFIPATPWFSLPYNNVTETDVRTASPQTGIADAEAPSAQRAMLEPMRPNPLRTHGEIAYTLTAAGDVRLTVVDVAGRVRAVLADGVQIRGRHAARWDARDGAGKALPAGVYFARLEVEGVVSSRKLVIEP